MAESMQNLRMKFSTTGAYFAFGAILLVAPLALILMWGGSSCLSNPSQFQCVSTSTFKMAASFLPFVMIVGGALIGYKMKKISDSLIPSEEPGEDETGEEHGSR